MTQITNDMKTPWFHADDKPARPGYYERDWGKALPLLRQRLDYWDGKHWYYGDSNGGHFASIARTPFPWRGLCQGATEPTKTPWYPATTTPARPGLYVVDYPGNLAPQDLRMVLWRWWTGDQWLSGAYAVFAPSTARLREAFPAPRQDVAWRGLTRKVKV